MTTSSFSSPRTCGCRARSASCSASHRRLSGPRRDPRTLPSDQEVIEESHTDKQSTFLVRTDEPILDPAWTVKPVTLEDLVLAYMSQARDPSPARPAWPGGRSMIRFTWMQFRVQAVVAARRTGDRRHRAGVDRPAPRPPLRHDGRQLRCPARLLDGDHQLHQLRRPLAGLLGLLLLVVPLLIGMFWGAPLVSRELETGTFRLAWTQGVSRTRWLAVKLGLGALTSMAAAGLLSLMVTWWSSQLDQVNANPFDSLRFGAATSSRSATPSSPSRSGSLLGCSSAACCRQC